MKSVQLKYQGNIYLTGFMGAGKTTIGKLLADELEWEFQDTDAVAEQATGMSVSEMFQRHGEAYFREQEQLALQRVAKKQNDVVATGGGIITSETNRRMLKESGRSVYLKWPIEVLLLRIGNARHRPLAANVDHESALTELFNQRRPFYEEADIVINCTPESTKESVVKDILNQLS